MSKWVSPNKISIFPLIPLSPQQLLNCEEYIHNCTKKNSPTDVPDSLWVLLHPHGYDILSFNICQTHGKPSISKLAFKHQHTQLIHIPNVFCMRYKKGISPPLCIHYNGSGLVVVASQHHPYWLAVQPVNVDGVCGLTGPVQGMAVYINAEVMWLLLWVLALVWRAHDSKRLQDSI